MRVAIYYSNNDIRIDSIPIPQIQFHEILMKVEASGICGSDVMEWYRKDKVPLVLGHEVAGTVFKIDRQVKRFKVGDRIVATHHVPCLKCTYCVSGHETVCDTLRQTHFHPGGFAEYIRLPKINVQLGTFKIPDKVSFEDASFVEPLGCVVRGQRLAKMSKGKTVLVVGSGLSGMLHIKLAKLLGAKKIFATDIDAFRLKKAKEVGAHHALLSSPDIPKKIASLNQGRKADLVIVCTGAQNAFKQALESLERGGVILIFTAASQDALLPLSTNDIFWRSEVTLLSSYAAAPVDLQAALEFIANKKIVVNDLITHRLPLEEIQKGFDLTVKPQQSMKVIINP